MKEEEATAASGEIRGTGSTGAQASLVDGDSKGKVIRGTGPTGAPSASPPGADQSACGGGTSVTAGPAGSQQGMPGRGAAVSGAPVMAGPPPGMGPPPGACPLVLSLCPLLRFSSCSTALRAIPSVGALTAVLALVLDASMMFRLSVHGAFFRRLRCMPPTSGG